MKSSYIIVIMLSAVIACGRNTQRGQEPAQSPPQKGQSAVKDSESERNILQTAMASPDHTILAGALEAAGYEDAICNCGPFTFFAPTDEAFRRLPEDQLSDLMKPENRNTLRDILEYHVYIGVISENMIRNGMVLGQVNGKKVTLTKDGEAIHVNGSQVLTITPVSNGIIYAIDRVLLPD